MSRRYDARSSRLSIRASSLLSLERATPAFSALADRRANPLIWGLLVWLSTAVWFSFFTFSTAMPLLVQRTPEGWQLPSLTTATMQLAGLVPLMMIIMERCFGVELRRDRVIATMLSAFALAHLMLAFGWDITATIAGEKQSIVLIAGAFCCGVGLVGNDLFILPFMERFDAIYFPAYFVGSYLSGTVLATLRIVQGASSYTCELDETLIKRVPRYESPRFGLKSWFAIIFYLHLTGLLAFYILVRHRDRLEAWHRRRVTPKSPTYAVPPSYLTQRKSSFDSTHAAVDTDTDNHHHNHHQPVTTETPKQSDVQVNMCEVSSRRQDVALLISIALMAGIQNTAQPCITSYASLPYSELTYYFIPIVSAFLLPVASFVMGLLPPQRPLVPVGLTIFTLALFAGVYTLALQSPTPWLKDSRWGSALTMSLQWGVLCVSTAVLVIASTIYRNAAPASECQTRLFHIGASAQLGTLLCTITSLLCVNVLELFTPALKCVLL